MKNKYVCSTIHAKVNKHQSMIFHKVAMISCSIC